MYLPYRLPLPKGQRRGQAGSPCKHPRTAEVLQAAERGHTCAALIKRHHKASEGFNGSYKKATVFVFSLKNKGQYTELVKQTRAAGLKGALPPAAAQPQLFVLCSLVPQCTLVGIS